MGVEEFADMMTTPIVVAAPSTARSLFGQVGASTAAGSTFMAHVIEINGVNRRVSGIDGYVSSVAWLNCTSTGGATRDSLFTFPDGSHPPVRAITYVRDDDGSVHHTKVAFG